MNDWRKTLLERQHWLTYLLPFLVFMLVGGLEPSPTKAGGGAIGLAIPYAYYPWVYAAKIALTAAAVIFVVPGYRAFPWRLTRWGIIAGLVGGPLWIGLALLDWEHLYLAPLLNEIGAGWLVGGERAAYNPFQQIPGHPAWAWTFLAVRFFGLVALVPIIEEFFLRGWLMRFVMEREWWKVPFGKASALAIVLGTVMPMLTHPELAGGGRLVLDDYLADAADAEHLGLRGRPRVDELDYGDLCCRHGNVAADVNTFHTYKMSDNSFSPGVLAGRAATRRGRRG